MKNITAIFILTFLCAFSINAQQKLYIMSNGIAIGEHNVDTEIDSVIFYTPNITSNPNTYYVGKILNAKYIGRWASVSTYDAGYYSGATVKVNFDGTTAQLNLGSNANYFYYSIDGGTFQYVDNASGNINLTPTPLTSGMHSLTIVANGGNNQQGLEILKINGLTLDPGSYTSPPNLSNKHIEFIGDSITQGWGLPREMLDNYGWIIGEELGVEHSHVAWSGIRLVDNVGGAVGMSRDYFTIFPLAGGGPWDFQKYQPNVVIINLGQNDFDGNVLDYRATYVQFITDIRQKYPNAYILAVEPFFQSLTPGIRSGASAAVLVHNAAPYNDSKVIYVPTGTLVTSEDYIPGGGIHPSVDGNIKIAAFLKPTIEQYVNMP